MGKSQGAELQRAARRSNRNEATFFQYLFLRDPLNSALLGQCWGQRDNHDSWALLSQSSQSRGETDLSQESDNPEQVGLGQGTQACCGSPVRVLTQPEGQGGLPGGGGF